MSKLRLINKEKGINFVNIGSSLRYDDDNLFIRPQTKTAYIIANDAILDGK